jgi:hypothetical protein
MSPKASFSTDWFFAQQSFSSSTNYKASIGGFSVDGELERMLNKVFVGYFKVLCYTSQKKAKYFSECSHFLDCYWNIFHWGDQDVDGRIILRWIFRKVERVVGTGWSWFRIGTGGGHLWVR